jgi:hypothetical protein
VIIQSTGSLSSTFQMDMPTAPGPAKSGDNNLCGDLTLTVTDNETPTAATPYGPTSLSSQMGVTFLHAANGDGTSPKPWVTGDSGTYTFSVAPTGADYAAFDSNDAVLGSSCTFTINFTQAST